MSKKENSANRHEMALKLLLGLHLGEALQLIGAQAAELTDWQVTSELENLNTAYNYMLQYFGQGVPDAGREALHRQLISRAILLNDDVSILARQSTSMLLADQARRQHLNHSIDYSSAKTALERFAINMQIASSDRSAPGQERLLEDHETLLSNMFTAIWISGLWSRENVSAINDIFKCGRILTNDKCLIVSAVTMAVLERFDPQKLLLLGELSSNADASISVRAITGFVLGVSKYNKILPYFTEVTSLIKLMSDSVEILSNIQSIQLALLMSRETDAIDRKMRDEIIPAMLKNNPGMKPPVNDANIEDINPDWEKWMEDSGIQKRLMEMTELQMEGADIYMSTFSNLKNYPFFKELSGWFRPFDNNQPDVRRTFAESGLSNTAIGRGLLSSGLFCNSDKYSFCLTFSQIPEIQRNQILGQIMPQSEGEENFGNPAQDNPSKKYDQNARQYVQDFYRFVKLYPRRHEFWDPFNSATNLFNIDSLHPLMDIPQFERTVAEFLLRKGHYEESASLFKRLLSRNGPESTDWQIWQKTGFALQKDYFFGEAIEVYMKADILEPDNLWTLRHIAVCHRECGHIDKAVEYLLQAERLSPDDMQLLLIVGETLISAGRYNEAMARFFKVEYSKPQLLQAKRDIAWCAFLCGKYEQSRKYWTIVLTETADQPSAQDLLNAAHLEWCAGNTPLAVTLYNRSISIIGKEKFDVMFNEDAPILLSQNLNDTDIMLMRDLLASGK